MALTQPRDAGQPDEMSISVDNLLLVRRKLQLLAPTAAKEALARPATGCAQTPSAARSSATTNKATNNRAVERGGRGGGGGKREKEPWASNGVRTKSVT